MAENLSQFNPEDRLQKQQILEATKLIVEESVNQRLVDELKLAAHEKNQTKFVRILSMLAADERDAVAIELVTGLSKYEGEFPWGQIQDAFNISYREDLGGLIDPERLERVYAVDSSTVEQQEGKTDHVDGVRIKGFQRGDKLILQPNSRYVDKYGDPEEMIFWGYRTYGNERISIVIKIDGKTYAVPERDFRSNFMLKNSDGFEDDLAD